MISSFLKHVFEELKWKNEEPTDKMKFELDFIRTKYD